MNLDDLPDRPQGARQAAVVRWRAGQRSEATDWLTDEVPIALEFNGISHAVMLATPLDLEDFALGFGLAEGLFESPADLYGCEIDASAAGVTVQMEVSSSSFARLKERRRSLVGRTGCGLCGTESLGQVLRPLPRADGDWVVSSQAIARGVEQMRLRQVVCRATGSVHAAAWCNLQGDVLTLREDVGRHNALDKLIGAKARSRAAIATPEDGFVVVTSRASVEMVQKAAMAGAALLAAVSAPTMLAVETAQACGMTLAGLVRQHDMVLYAHPQRVSLPESA